MAKRLAEGLALEGEPAAKVVMQKVERLGMVTPNAAFEHLSRPKSWHKLAQPKMLDGQCVLACCHCGHQMTGLSNPTTTINSHLGSRAGALCARALSGFSTAAEDYDDESASVSMMDPNWQPSTSGRQSSGPTSSGSGQQQAKLRTPASKAENAAFNEDMLKFVITSEGSFLSMNNKHLRNACARAGFTLADETSFRTNILDNLWEKTNKDIKLEVSALVVSCGCVATMHASQQAATLAWEGRSKRFWRSLFKVCA